MSRPRKQRSDRMPRQIIFRLDDANYDRLEADARRAGLSVNQLARRLTCQRAGKLVIRTCHRFDPAFLKRLERIGHNLNQLVKNAHIFKRVSPQVAELCERISAMIDEAVEQEVDE